METLGRRDFIIAGALAMVGSACGRGSRQGSGDPDYLRHGRILEGRNCLVTGATSGIGAVTAVALARLGANVIVAGRNPGKCAAQVDAIRRVAGDRVTAVVADLAHQDRVRWMADEVARRFTRLDVLVNNAGTYLFDRKLTPERLEKTFAVNYLSHFLLTNLLLERLRASAAARVVCVSSAAHHDGSIDFDNLQGERRYDRLDAYSRSKLALLMFSYELSRRLAGSSVTVNALHPGVVATNLGSENGFVRGWLRVRVRNLLSRSMISPEEGARPSIRLASSPELAGVTGRYFDQEQDAPSSTASQDRGVARKLWEVSEELTGLHGPAHR